MLAGKRGGRPGSASNATPMPPSAFLSTVREPRGKCPDGAVLCRRRRAKWTEGEREAEGRSDGRKWAKSRLHPG